MPRMLSRWNRRCRSWRTLIAVLLALAFVWQPIVLMATEAHASDHLLQTGHSHDGDFATGTIPDDERRSADSSERLHELLHQAQCCTSLLVIPSSDLLLAAPISTNAVPELIDSAFATRSCGELLRPPRNA
ncbi:MAG: hypothetical protein E6Q43_00995 [Dokdonella sp.]|nr:MAG: hypothetical protein EYC71_12540 [Gammaproteobacteria bacterium]TXI77529.1 MAG: hypothetical protein E6Q43_00995 [Dokdonella sp.]